MGAVFREEDRPFASGGGDFALTGVDFTCLALGLLLEAKKSSAVVSFPSGSSFFLNYQVNNVKKGGTGQTIH